MSVSDRLPVRAMVIETGYEWLGLMEQMVGRKYPDTTPIAAGVTNSEDSKTQVMLHGMPQIFWVPKGTHTVGDFLVYLPQDNVLVTSDIVGNGIVPVMQDASIKNWIGTLEEILELDVSTFVPGHGDLMTMSDVKALHRAIAGFYSGVKAGHAKGLREKRNSRVSRSHRLEETGKGVCHRQKYQPGVPPGNRK